MARYSHARYSAAARRHYSGDRGMRRRAPLTRICAHAYGSASAVAVGSKGGWPVAEVNGIDVDELRSYVSEVARDRSRTDRDPVVVARWVGSDQSDVTMADGGPAV